MPPQKKSSINIAGNIKTPGPVKVSCGCIYGDVDNGKTHLLCTAAEYFEPEKVLIVTLDRQDETVSKFADKGIKVLDLLGACPTAHGAADIYSGQKELLKFFRTQGGKYSFVGYDSLSKHHQALLAQSVAARDRGDDYPEQRDYGYAKNRLVEFVWGFRQVAIAKGFHLWMTAWEKSEWIDDSERSDGGYTYYYPDLPPEAGRIIRHDFSFLARLVGTRQAIRTSSKGNSVKLSLNTSLDTELRLDGKKEVSKNRVGFPTGLKNVKVEDLLKAGGYLKEVEPEVPDGEDEEEDEIPEPSDEAAD